MVTSKTLTKINFIQKFQHDLYTQHAQNVANLTYQLAFQIKTDYPKLGLTDKYIDNLSIAALLHDIGKIFIPYYILAKTDTLTLDEYLIIQKHPLQGYKFLDSVFLNSSLNKEDKELVKLCKEVCLHHQERLNGSGYPDMLNSKTMSIAAKITSITDSFDAMTAKRVYRVNISPLEAMSILKKESNKYDERFIKSFEKVIKQKL